MGIGSDIFFAEAKDVGLGGMMTLLVGSGFGMGTSVCPLFFGVAVGVCLFSLLRGASAAGLVNSVSLLASGKNRGPICSGNYQCEIGIGKSPAIVSDKIARNLSISMPS